jgi:hypothetical protein
MKSSAYDTNSPQLAYKVAPPGPTSLKIYFLIELFFIELTTLFHQQISTDFYNFGDKIWEEKY